MAALAVAWGVLAYYVNMPGTSAVMFVAGFIAWFVAAMAPVSEKYKHDEECQCNYCCEDITEEYYAEQQARIKQEEEIEAEAEADFHAMLAQDMLDNPEDHGLI